MPVIPKDKPLYSIGTVAEIFGITPRCLRLYEDKDLIRPARVAANRRLYSQNDLDKLEYIHYLIKIRGVTLRGVKVILEILEGLPQAEQAAVYARARDEMASLNKGSTELAREASQEAIQQILEDSRE
ncbi:MAG: MerR family transcriptional regulator [Armatimonadetes bacterium]|nr:MerR family transcriptional regulator [Armatimonadota bacterium]NIO98327.1 MerR family transcriptional regulator [Armatimonadota bacterium]